jgi:hypothetical protein
MQAASLIAGTLGEFSSSGSEGTIAIAPEGQWRAQLPHSTSSVSTTQFFLIQTA